MKKDKSGKIVALCNAGQGWSPRKTADVIKDISSNEWSYYVQELGRRSYVRLQQGVLQTSADAPSGNNLSNLPIG
ncbi:MAG TPA: hypothetical protein VGM29_03550 [Polyangiaceae bacterium]